MSNEEEQRRPWWLRLLSALCAFLLARIEHRYAPLYCRRDDEEPRQD